MQFDDATHKIAYEYDELGRIKERALTNGSAGYTTTYTFVAGGYGTNSTTPLVAGITQGTGSNAMNFAYAYDSRGNITSETRNGKVTTYTYDALGQLIRVNDPHDTTAGTSGTTWLYTYDRGGNILSKSYYAYTTGTPGTAVDTIAYSYTDSNWKDKLTAYDGQTITYDAIGNPLNDGTWTYTWEKGRQLKQMSKAGMTVEFAYDHNGLRTQKKVTSGGEVTVTEYTLHGKLVTHLTRGSDEMHFFYDAQSRPAMVEFNGTLYSYVHNLQGDIVGILDNAGSLVVEYKYDAWGKPVLVRTLTTAYEVLAELNPFRYRGYVYDEETGLYYLRSRYYSSEKSRFLNADIQLYVEGFALNVYAYCGSNPLIRTDDGGFAWYNNVWNWVKDTASDAWDWTKNAVSEGWEWTTQTAEKVGDWVAQVSSGVWSWVSQAASDAWNWVSQAASDAWNWVTRAASDAWNWVTQAAKDVGGWIARAAKNVAQALKAFFSSKITKGVAGIVAGVGSIVLGILALSSPEPVATKSAGTKAVVKGVAGVVAGVAGVISGICELVG